MRVTFDRVLNVLLLVAVVYGVGVMRPQVPRTPPTYTAGEQVPAITGLSYTAAKRTAVLFVRSSCHFCTESMPFYRQLAEQHQVVAISGEPRESLEAYLNEHDLRITSATVKKGEWAKLTVTPTIIVVDDAGKVVKSWVGLLSEEGQRSVRAVLQ